MKVEREGQLHYLESIVEAFDKVAESAVNNYQLQFAVDEVVAENETTAKETAKSKTTTSKNGYTITDNKEVTKNVKETDNSGTVSQTDTDGERASRLLDEVQTGDVSGVREQQKSVAPSSERRRETERNSDRTDTADRSGRSEGNGEIRDIRGNDGLSEEVCTIWQASFLRENGKRMY